MSQFLFVVLLLLLSLIRVPLSLLVIVLKPLVPFLNDRLLFERKNLEQESSLSFKKESIKADFCFEVSSEGELEQVQPLLEIFLERGKKVEILFSSPSVEKKCLQLYERHPSLVRLLRLPLLSFWPVDFLYFQSLWGWVTAPVVVFCRYDFFPELLLLKIFKKKFVLLSGAFKKKNLYKLLSFRFFEMVVAATEEEKICFQKLLQKEAAVFACDLRIPRIAHRFLHASTTLEARPFLKAYVSFLNTLPGHQKIILGSAWESDLSILEDETLKADIRESRIHLLVVPHKLDEDFIGILKRKLVQLFGEENVGVLKEGENYSNSPVVLLSASGVLCELYSLFTTSYVGGGYERSIHSVLEPFFSTSQVLVGPKIHRSTEFDLVKEIAPEEIHVLIRPESFYTVCKKNFLGRIPDATIRTKAHESAALEMRRIIDLLIN